MIVGIGDNPRPRLEQRGGLAFLDKKSGFVKWMNCSFAMAIMPAERSSHHETLMQELFIEVQGPGALKALHGEATLVELAARHGVHAHQIATSTSCT